ncbi:unnamed protein product [Schistosoma mattheei]|uniref:Uncharacterized protein n=1 Tax=Schistosoma mattheei TaxID=31246 RepID=A0AA85BWN9_9TREM|nr:unnamed protein product [Schistosoma mattheei]
MPPPTTNTGPAFRKPRIPFKLASFKVPTLTQTGQHIGFAMTLEDLNIDICCLSETRIQDSSEVLQIRSPSVTSKSLFFARLYTDTVASSSGAASMSCCSFRSTYVDYDHALVCANPILRISGQQIHHPKRIGVSKLVAASVATKYQTQQGSRLTISPIKSIDEH